MSRRINRSIAYYLLVGWAALFIALVITTAMANVWIP